ncbi:DUF6094 domain-containing protein [Pseudomonas sp. NPDC088368]|uniref:DUF6094 domain-containing protein n=1 Tax=Pseudomonas sp. NPDC088368 TaxID=3364453 RepID=UPI00382BA56B
MALMFPRLARNFARNGYYPTDEVTLERTLQALTPSPNGKMRILDPCAGEGVALAEAAHALGRADVLAYAVEYDQTRADHSRTLLDCVLHADLMDTMISRQSFGLLWLNPPYGDLVADHAGASQYQGTGRRRLEKAFYQRSLPLLQYGGVLVFIVPHYVLDDELCGWLCNHFTDLRIYAGSDPTFKQVVIFGIRIRRQDLARTKDITLIRSRLLGVGADLKTAEPLPASWPWEPYRVLPVINDIDHFYRMTMEPAQFQLETQRLKGLWPDFTLHFGQHSSASRAPLRPLSHWHLALALAAGAISGVVTSGSGRTLILKGNTYKDKTRKTEFTEDEDGNVREVRILTDRFVPIIRAWDMTTGSPTYGQALIISSAADGESPPDIAQEPEHPPLDVALFVPGRMLVTQTVKALMDNHAFDVAPYLARHLSGDWGDIDSQDWSSNQRALETGDRLVSGYNIHIKGESRLLIITDDNREATTVMLPADY